MSPRTTLLAIDDALLPLKRNLCLHLARPQVREAPVLTPSPRGSGAPDDCAVHFYGTVLQDQGRFRMWYYACHWGANPDWPPQMARQIARLPSWMKGAAPLYQGPLCYAESTDGVHWEKPALGQVLFKGSRANNALALPHTVVSGAAVLLDAADPDPARRYKLVYQYFPDQAEPVIEAYGSLPTIALAHSADGLTWTPAGIPFVGQFVEHCSFLRHRGWYIVHSQTIDTWNGVCAEGGTPCGRVGVAHVSPDFASWPDYHALAFALPEPADPAQRGILGRYDQVHLGVGAASLGNVCVGLYGLWHNAADFGEIAADLGLLISHDGVRFWEPVKGHAFIRADASPCTPAPGRVFPTVLCQGNGILNVGDETRIYHGRWRNVGQAAADLQLYGGEAALATLPRDRWGALALAPRRSEGAVASVPFVLPRQEPRITLNAEHGDLLSVELLDESLRPLPGFSGPAAGVVADSGLDGAVRWPGGDLTRRAGQTVRLQVGLRTEGDRQPRLYAIYLEAPVGLGT